MNNPDQTEKTDNSGIFQSVLPSLETFLAIITGSNPANAQLVSENSALWNTIPVSHKFADPYGKKWAYVKPNIKMDPKKLETLEKGLQHPAGELIPGWELYKHYPDLANVSVSRLVDHPSVVGAFFPSRNVASFRKNPFLSSEAVLAHEIGGHAVQLKEKLPPISTEEIGFQTAKELNKRYGYKPAPIGEPEKLEASVYKEAFPEAMARIITQLYMLNASSGTDWTKFYDVDFVRNMPDLMLRTPVKKEGK